MFLYIRKTHTYMHMIDACVCVFNIIEYLVYFARNIVECKQVMTAVKKTTSREFTAHTNTFCQLNNSNSYAPAQLDFFL